MPARKSLRAIIAGLLGVGVLSSAPSKGTAEAPRHLPLSAVVRVTRGRTNEPTELPDDPELPALGVIRERGLAGSIPSLGLGGAHVKLRLCGYTPGARATFGARASRRRFAVKVYAKDPEPEAKLYEALAAAGLASDSGARVPRLLAWERDLRVLVIGWLDGTPANLLVKQGRGARAGELAAIWLRHALSLPVISGPPVGAADVLRRVPQWVGRIGKSDRALGAAAAAVAERLAQTLPREGASGLVHGSLYARHVLELGDGPGVIDWQRFGRGPIELDAGVFLATIWRIGLEHGRAAGEAARAEETFLAETTGILDGRALAWHRAAALLRVAEKRLRRDDNRLSPGRALVCEAARLAESSGDHRAKFPSSR